MEFHKSGQFRPPTRTRGEISPDLSVGIGTKIAFIRFAPARAVLAQPGSDLQRGSRRYVDMSYSRIDSGFDNSSPETTLSPGNLVWRNLPSRESDVMWHHHRSVISFGSKNVGILPGLHGTHLEIWNWLTDLQASRSITTESSIDEF
jgi:hypothetical protein